VVLPWRKAVALVLAVGGVAAEQRLYLKTGQEWRRDEIEDLAAAVKRRYPDRRHLLLEFAERPSAEQLREIEQRGARLLGYVPDGGFMVSLPEGVSLEGLGLRRAVGLRASEKLSPLLEAADRWECVVEFYPDVAPTEARALVLEHGLELIEHPDVRPNELVVRGEPGGIRRLAEWDEVSYVYPASEELVAGAPVQACPGPLTVWGPVAQYVARVGEGWDGPGLNSTELAYFIASLARSLPAETARAEILRALGEWARYVKIRFFPGDDEWAPRTLRILFASGQHGDPYPFDGRGGVLAHAFYPAPPNPEPIAGDVHLDNDEPWNVGDYIDLYSVILHELGHALGLGHSDKPGTVMYPYYRKHTGLTPDDIAAIRELYAAREPESGGQPPGTPSPPSSPPALPPSSPPSTPPANPQPPSNPSPKPPSGADTVAPSLTITYPPTSSALVSSSTITLRGLASDNVGVSEVSWSSSTGASGLAQGTTQWTAGPIPLYQGTNTIVVKARDAAGNSSWRSVVITRK